MIRNPKPRSIPTIGGRYGKFVVLAFKSITRYKNRPGKENNYIYKWECLCDCGNIKSVKGSSLLSGKTRSCGCIRISTFLDRITKHNMAGTKEWRSWCSMKNRCLNENYSAYPDYGDRGITISSEWTDIEKGFYNFYKDMGKCPEGMSLDRINVDGNYCKENCRWASTSMQNFNQRKKSSNTSGRTGVNKLPSGRYRSQINVGGKCVNLGSYGTFEEACEAREHGEILYFGFIKE